MQANTNKLAHKCSNPILAADCIAVALVLLLVLGLNLLFLLRRRPRVVALG